MCPREAATTGKIWLLSWLPTPGTSSPGPSHCSPTCWCLASLSPSASQDPPLIILHLQGARIKSFSEEAGEERGTPAPVPWGRLGITLGKGCTRKPCLTLCHRGPDPGPDFPHVNEASWRLRGRGGSHVHFYKLVRRLRTAGLGLTDHLFH